MDEEFLSQFEGKSISSEFEIVRTLDDLMFVPAKIKAMRGELQLSEIIAQEVKAILTRSTGNPVNF